MEQKSAAKNRRDLPILGAKAVVATKPKPGRTKKAIDPGLNESENEEVIEVYEDDDEGFTQASEMVRVSTKRQKSVHDAVITAEDVFEAELSSDEDCIETFVPVGAGRASLSLKEMDTLELTEDTRTLKEWPDAIDKVDASYGTCGASDSESEPGAKNISLTPAGPGNIRCTSKPLTAHSRGSDHDADATSTGNPRIPKQPNYRRMSIVSNEESVAVEALVSLNSKRRKEPLGASTVLNHADGAVPSIKSLAKTRPASAKLAPGTKKKQKIITVTAALDDDNMMLDNDNNPSEGNGLDYLSVYKIDGAAPCGLGSLNDAQVATITAEAVDSSVSRNSPKARIQRKRAAISKSVISQSFRRLLTHQA